MISSNSISTTIITKLKHRGDDGNEKMRSYDGNNETIVKPPRNNENIPKFSTVSFYNSQSQANTTAGGNVISYTQQLG
jgi:hypothetical protein